MPGTRSEPAGIGSTPRPESVQLSPGPEPQPIRLALDFGTSTTLVALKQDRGEPRLLLLEPNSPEMPSYIARRDDGTFLFGREALNYGSHVHSVKLRLRANDHLETLGIDAQEAAHLLIDEAIRRALKVLQRERIVSGEVDTLAISMNVGCTPAFNLEQRLRLRDICLGVGLTVRLVNLVEEPVAAAFELGLSGAAPYGRTMVIDIGGGTLDVAVLRTGASGADFVVFATGGVELGGDRYTAKIVDHLRKETAADLGVDVSSLELSRQDETAIWNRAETAKLSLSTQETTTVALPTGRDLVLTREWFLTETARLTAAVMAFAKAMYRQARLTLDRGDADDPQPGSATYWQDGDGRFKTIHALNLNDDGREHLDSVFMVGGASRMPFLQQRFEQQLADRLFDAEVFGVDPVRVVALGLGRHEALDRIELRYPNWQVVALIAADGEQREIELYEPFAPIFQLTPHGPTATYNNTVSLPSNVDWKTVSLEFRPVSRTQGEKWPARSLPVACESLTLSIDLFGSVTLTGSGAEIYPDLTSPFALDGRPRADWLPRRKRAVEREFCIHSVRRGQCDYIWCPHHPSGGVDLNEE